MTTYEVTGDEPEFDGADHVTVTTPEATVAATLCGADGAMPTPGER